MLGRKKAYWEKVSFGIDLVTGSILLAFTFFSLKYFKNEWQSFLQFVTGYPFQIEGVDHLGDQGWIFLAILVHVFGALLFSRFYQSDLFTHWSMIAFNSMKALLVGFGMLTLFFYFFEVLVVNRSLFFGFFILFYIYLVTKEILLRRYLVLKFYRKRPFEALLVCSTEEAGERFMETLYGPMSSVIIKAVLLTEGVKEQLPEVFKGKVLRGLEAMEKALSESRYDLVILGDNRGLRSIAQKVVWAAEEQGVEVWYFANFPIPQVAKFQVDEYRGRPVVVMKTTSHYEGKLIVKQLFDFCVTVIGLILISPLFLILACVIKLNSKGPIFFKQVRTGWRGHPFMMLKFRTMFMDAEEYQKKIRDQNEMSGPVFKASDDPRITPVGRFMRRYSLDELPQLINVLKGEMSLVGPRPLPVYETKQFETFRDHRRYSVLPGLTGLWQVSGRNEITDFQEWVKLDLNYIDHWSLLLDIKILLKTIPVVLRGTGAR